jgi:WD40 repeat protein
MRSLAVIAVVLSAFACSRDDTLRVEPIVAIEHAAHVAFDPHDETHFLVVEQAGAIVVWKRTENENMPVLTIRTDAVDAIFYGDGITSVHRDGSLRRWRLDGSPQAHEARPDQPSRATVIETLGDRIITGDESGRLHFWSKDLKDSPVDAHPGGVIAVAADEQRGVVVSAGKDGKVMQWRAAGDGPLTEPQVLPFHGEPLDTALASDGLLAIGGRTTGGGAIDLVDLPHGGSRRRIQYPLPVTSLSFSRLTGALAASPGSVITINRDGDSIGPREGLYSDLVKFSPRGEMLAAISTVTGSIELYSLAGVPLAEERIATHTELPQHGLPPGRGRGLGGSLVRPFGNGFVAATIGGNLTFTDALGKTTKQWLLPEVARFVALGVSDAKGFVAVASDDGRAWICRVGASPSILPESDIHDLAVSSGGLIAVEHSSDSTIQFRAEGGGPASDRIRLASLLEDMLFVNEDTLALLDRKGLELLSVTSQRRRSPALPGGHSFDRLAASADGSRYAAGASDGTIALFDGNAKLVATLRPKSAYFAAPSLTDLAFSPGERVLAAAHEFEGDVRLWNTKDGTPWLQPVTATIPRSSSPVFNYVVSIAFARTSDRLLALHSAGDAVICRLTLAPLPKDSLQSQSWNATTVSNDARAIVTAPGKGGAFWWKPDGSGNFLDVDRDKFNIIKDVVFSRDGQTLFALTEMFKPVVARNATSKAWSVGESTSEEHLSTTAGEAIYLSGSNVHRWKLGHAPIAGAAVNASDVKLAPIAATDDVALAWNRENGKGTVAIASGNAVTWQKEVSTSIIAIAAPFNGESMFATSSVDARVTLWHASGGGWSAAQTVATSDTTPAQSLAFDSHGHLLIGTEGGSVESHDVRSGKVVDIAHLGNSVSRVGTTTNRVWASLGNGQIVFLSRDLQIKATMSPVDDQAIVATPDGWHSGTRTRARFFRGTSLTPLSELETTPMYSREAVTAAITGQWERWQNVRAFAVASINSVRTLVGKIPLWQRLLAIPPFLYSLFFIFLSLTMLLGPHRLAGWAMQRRDDPEPPPLPEAVKWLMLIKWFGHMPRAVDAWMARSRNELLSRCFTSLDNVKKRVQYVDLGNALELEAWRAAVTKQEETGLWISGPGGCGKSTLAFVLARRAIADIERPPLPVVIDTDWSGELLNFVRQRLSLGEHWVTAKMLDGLARRGRIAIVVDGLSERRVPDAKGQVIRAWASGVLRYLIVASRDGAPQEAHMREVRVGPLTEERLPDFAREYIAEEKVDSAVGQLKELANGQPIRPLFARLALERIAEGKALPTNYPKLVHEYVVALQPRDPHSLAPEDFLLAARICAFSVVDEHLAPTQVSPDYIRARLNEASLVSGEEKPTEITGAECINQLVTCGLLDRVETEGAILLRFAFDLIAEYLAAMEMVHRPDLERNTKLREKIMAAPECALREALDRVMEIKAAA